MAKANWGTKRVCLGCQATFYDMRRDPITCPKCGVVHAPVALLKSDGRPPRKRRLPPTVIEREPPAAEVAAAADDDDDDDEPAEIQDDKDAELIDADDELEPDEAEESKA